MPEGQEQVAIIVDVSPAFDASKATIATQLC
jgi:hypothetical protein